MRRHRLTSLLALLPAAAALHAAPVVCPLTVEDLEQLYTIKATGESRALLLHRAERLLERRGRAFSETPEARQRLAKLDPDLSDFALSAKRNLARTPPPACSSSPGKPEQNAPSRLPIPETHSSPKAADRWGFVDFLEPAGYWTSRNKTGSCEVILVIDGEADFEVRGNLILWQEKKARPPRGAFGRPSQCSQPFPKGALKSVNVKQTAGRGASPLFRHAPAEDTLYFTINDDRKDNKDLPGSDVYVIRIEWEAP